MAKTVEQIERELRKALDEQYRLEGERDDAFRHYQGARSRAENAAATVTDLRRELSQEEDRLAELENLRAENAALKKALEERNG